MSDDPDLTLSDALLATGIQAEMGTPLDRALTLDDLARWIKKGAHDELRASQAGALYEQKTEGHLGPWDELDAESLAEAGWAVVFAPGAPVDELRQALAPLLALRREQAGPLYKEISGDAAPQPGQDWLEFLRRHRAAPGSALPDRMPYYLLLVGDPASLPFSFQADLDISYAVGRLWLPEREDYARYAEGVKRHEMQAAARPRRAALFAPRNPGDRTAWLTSRYLVEKGLAAELPGKLTQADLSVVPFGEATKERLGRLLGGDETPSLLFTAGHGMAFADPALLRARQGALLCQDWAGPGHAITPEHYFCGEDLGKDADLSGLVAFFFACHSAGTPRERFGPVPAGGSPILADPPFLARLPQRLLAHPGGSALAAIGHIDRGYCYAFIWDQTGPQVQPFTSALRQMLSGRRVGHALDTFGWRYAEISKSVERTRDLLRAGKELSPVDAGLALAAYDAGNFVVLGDPAVRLG